MDFHDRIERAIVPEGSGASLSATSHMGLVCVEALTPRAEAWLQEYAGEEATWNGKALVVEKRFWPLLADAAIANGLTFERDALPN